MVFITFNKMSDITKVSFIKAGPVFNAKGIDRPESRTETEF